MLCVGADLINAGSLINAGGVYSGIYGSSMTSLIVASSVTSLSSVKQSVTCLHGVVIICGAVR